MILSIRMEGSTYYITPNATHKEKHYYPSGTV